MKEEDRVKMMTPLMTQYTEISDYYIHLKKWNKSDLDRSDYNRIHKAIKVMLEKSAYDKEKVKRVIKWCYDKYLGTHIDWTIETCIKKYPEANRPVKAYEKYMKPQGRSYGK